MGNCLRLMYSKINERYVIMKLSSLLDQAIANKVADDTKYQCNSDVDPSDVCRLEKMMEIVRGQICTSPWGEVIQMVLTLLMTRECVVETFCAVIANLTHNFERIKVHHLLSLYAMIVDTVSLYVREKQCNNMLHDLREIHIFIISKTDVNELSKMLSVIECVTMSS